ncbi:MAG TPA: hypothetical protein PKA27_13710 [Fimbriimonadaceae bacterium]|nr:hypothetical protein [Fimbriimonadaceae bacterium]
MSLAAHPFDRECLNQALSSKRFPEAYRASKGRIDYLEDHLTHLGVASLLIEEDYIDGEYLEDFASYYARCHVEYDRHCKRIHFFAKPKSLDAVHASGVLDTLLLTQDDQTLLAYQSAYLGFVVARPLPETIIGRTVLKPWPESEGAKVRHFRLLQGYSAHLMGLRLPIASSLAFQEQDSACGACATVALWSALQLASRLFGTACPRPATITQLASPLHAHVLGRTLPSQGLSILQMCNAIRATGLEPEVFRLRPERGVAPTAEWLSLIQAYVSASIPVILVTHVRGVDQLHAVPVCGLGYDTNNPKQVFESGDPPPISLTGSYLRAVYAHDDQRGPYCHYYPTDAICSTGESGFLREYSGKVPESRTQRVLEPLFAIVPVYGKVRINFLDIQKSVTTLSGLLHQLLGTDVEHFEWDVRLSLSNTYKANLRENSHQHPEYKSLLLSPMPRFVWVTKLLIRNQPVWEVIWDATDTPRSVPIVVSIWHSSQMLEKLSQRLDHRVKGGLAVDTQKMSQALAKWFLEEIQPSNQSS